MVGHEILQSDLKSSVLSFNQIYETNFVEILKSSDFKNIFINLTNGDNITAEIRKCIEDYVSLDDTPSLHSQYITAGVACLLLFIQQNWTGPIIEPPELPGFNYNDSATLKIQRDKILAELVEDGENTISVVE